MKVLIIGGTGVISTHVLRLIEMKGNETFVINRGKKTTKLNGKSQYIKADANDVTGIKDLIKNEYFDVVIDFVSFSTKDILKRYELLKGKIGQYIFISSATVYNVKSGIVTENSPIGNEFNDYSRKKIECERLLLEQLNCESFPTTIIRPSHTYDSTCVPLGIHGKFGSWQNVKRIAEGKKVIIHDDGTGLWTMLRSEDFAAQLYGVLGKSETLGNEYHITLEESKSWEFIYSIVADEIGMPLHPCFISSEYLAKEGSEFDLSAKLYGDKARTLIFKNDKIKEIIGEYNNIYSIENGIRDSVRNVMRHKKYQIEDYEFDKWCDKMVSMYS